MTRWLTAGAAAALAAMLLGACRDGSDDSAGGRELEVVASFYPVAELATRVGGARVRVTNLTPAGVEPHDLELTSGQVDRLEDADLVIYLGEGFQPAIAEIASRRGDGAVDILDAVDVEQEGDVDPHFWLDPTLMIAAVEVVEDALAEADPDGAATYRANAETYEAELGALDRDLERGLADCARREIVTTHAAFAYLADRYGLTQLPIAGVSPEAEPDPDRLADLTDEIRARGITTVFFEELASKRVAETLAREAGVTTAVLHPIEGLTKEDVAAGRDYAAVMRDNLATLRAALGCR